MRLVEQLRWWASECDRTNFGCQARKLLIEAAEALEKAEPVRHGRWIEDGYYNIPCVCSYCGKEAHYTSTFEETFDYDWEENLQSTGYEEQREYIRSEYCPNCGAKMDKPANT